jgi:hypothetical protein
MNQFSSKQLYQSHKELLHKRSIKGKKKSNGMVKRNIVESGNCKDLKKKGLISRWQELYDAKKEKGALGGRDTIGKTVTLDWFSSGRRERLSHRGEIHFESKQTGPLSKGDANFKSLGFGSNLKDVKMSARTEGAV